MVYLFLANGFEEIEALAVVDVLRRANIEVKTVGIGGQNITGAHGISVRSDISENEIDYNDITAVILPGGMPGTTNLLNSKTVEKAVLTANQNDNLVAAICAAPIVLGKLGLLNNKEATCFPGFEGKLNGAKLSCEKVCKSGNIITATAAGAAIDFALKIVGYLISESAADKLKNELKYN
jgi:4-methyl-5(b-hydroxyethyl)-thiazole monophosphate biosynthesis